jgi:hypothetical protein
LSAGCEQIHAIEGRTRQSTGDFASQGVIVGQIGRFSRRTDGRRLDGNGEGFLLFERLDDRGSAGECYVQNGLTALHGILDGVQGTHFGALARRNGEDGTVVLGGRNVLAGVDPVLGGFQFPVGLVQRLKCNLGAEIRIDAVSHFWPFPSGCAASSEAQAFCSQQSFQEPCRAQHRKFIIKIS